MGAPTAEVIKNTDREYASAFLQKNVAAPINKNRRDAIDNAAHFLGRVQQKSWIQAFDIKRNEEETGRGKKANVGA
ncbi:MAG TPA: hypothetical protein VGG97_11520 [Bryobacteraceae bacterium]|jgi:hypothetical protein